MSGPARPVTPGTPQDAPQEAPAGQDGPRPLPGQPLPAPTGPRPTAPRQHVCTRPDPCQDGPQEAPQDGPGRPWPGDDPTRLAALTELRHRPQDGPQDGPPRLWQTRDGAHWTAPAGTPWPDRTDVPPGAPWQPQDGPPAAPHITVTPGRLYVAPIGTAAPYEAPDPCAMAPYAPPGPDDAAPGNPWRDLGILAGPLPTGPQDAPQDGPDDERARLARALDVPPATLTGPTLAELRQAELADVRPDLAALTGRTHTMTLTWPTDALRNAFRALGIDLDHAAAEQARQDEAAAWRRGLMRDLRARARARRSGRPLPAPLDPQGA